MAAIIRLFRPAIASLVLRVTRAKVLSHSVFVRISRPCLQPPAVLTAQEHFERVSMVLRDVLVHSPQSLPSIVDFFAASPFSLFDCLAQVLRFALLRATHHWFCVIRRAHLTRARSWISRGRPTNSCALHLVRPMLVLSKPMSLACRQISQAMELGAVLLAAKLAAHGDALVRWLLRRCPSGHERGLWMFGCAFSLISAHLERAHVLSRADAAPAVARCEFERQERYCCAPPGAARL